MASRSPSLLSVPIRRRRAATASMPMLLPVRERVGADLRLFLIAWALGFLAFYAFLS